MKTFNSFLLCLAVLAASMFFVNQVEAGVAPPPATVAAPAAQRVRLLDRLKTRVDSVKAKMQAKRASRKAKRSARVEARQNIGDSIE